MQLNPTPPPAHTPMNARIRVTVYVSLRRRVRKTLTVFLSRSDGEVYEKGEGTLNL